MNRRQKMKNVVVAVIENIEPAERAAEMVISLIETELAGDAEGAGALLPLNTHPERRTRAPRGDAAPNADGPLDPEGWYSMGVAAARTGFARSSLDVIVRDQPERLRSKKEGRWRVCLGADIVRLAAERANGARGKSPQGDGTGLTQ